MPEECTHQRRACLDVGQLFVRPIGKLFTTAQRAACHAGVLGIAPNQFVGDSGLARTGQNVQRQFAFQAFHVVANDT